MLSLQRTHEFPYTVLPLHLATLQRKLWPSSLSYISPSTLPQSAQLCLFTLFKQRASSAQHTWTRFHSILGVARPRSSHDNYTIVIGMCYKHNKKCSQPKDLKKCLDLSAGVNTERFIMKINWMLCSCFGVWLYCLLCAHFNWIDVPCSSIRQK